MHETLHKHSDKAVRRIPVKDRKEFLDTWVSTVLSSSSDHNCYSFVRHFYDLMGIQLPYIDISRVNFAEQDIIRVVANLFGFITYDDRPIAGDIVVFRLRWSKFPDHLGVYTGRGKFIHCNNHSISVDRMSRSFWKKSLCFVMARYE